MRSSSPESSGPCSPDKHNTGPDVAENLTNDNQKQRHESSSVSEEQALNDPQQQQLQHQDQQELGGGRVARSVSSDNSEESKESSWPDGGIASIGDDGVRQIMEPALRQMEAATVDMGASVHQSLARNIEYYANLKCNASQEERRYQTLFSRVDLCEKLFLRCLASVACQLEIHVGSPGPNGPDPALVDAFVSVRRSAETLADRLRNSLQSAARLCDERQSLFDTDADATDAAAAWAKAEASVSDPRQLIEAFGRIADRAVWRRLRHRRLRDCHWPTEPAVFAALTLHKKTLNASAGAAPKFHREEAVRYLLAAMICKIASVVDTAVSVASAFAPAASATASTPTVSTHENQFHPTAVSNPSSVSATVSTSAAAASV